MQPTINAAPNNTKRSALRRRLRSSSFPLFQDIKKVGNPLNGLDKIIGFHLLKGHVIVSYCEMMFLIIAILKDLSRIYFSFENWSI